MVLWQSKEDNNQFITTIQCFYGLLAQAEEKITMSKTNKIIINEWLND